MKRAVRRGLWPAIVAAFCGLWAVAQGAAGAWLLWLGGSPYYLAAAALQLLGAVWLLRGHRHARTAFHLLLAGTAAWALWETGGAFWGMVSRLGFVLLVWLLALSASRRPRSGDDAASGRGRRIAAAAAGASALLLVAIAGGRLVARDAPPSGRTAAAAGTDAVPQEDWPAYGRTLGASRFSPLEQITPANAGELEVAWTYRTGDMPRASDAGTSFNFEATPLKIGDSLYLCTPHNIVIALDAETGRERWRHDPAVADKGAFVKACRGVAHFRAADTADCPERILAGTLDARLIALDARTGRPCPGFGRDGALSLLDGLGAVPPGFVYVTSPPLVVGRAVIVGGYIVDGWSIGQASGVVRAFDAETGALLWAWDMGRPENAAGPAPGGTYTPGTPNVWAPMSADPALGLVYLPTGNATPDYWGAHRSAVMGRYASSVVAVDVATGAPRWSFQTVHHDIWDYDLPSNPMLVDLEVDGRAVPALIQLTKSGQIFILDRRDGTPLRRVAERPVPQGGADGERLSPTQPFSDVPSLTPPPLTEASMWGITPLDQIACRASFRKHRYEGLYTPISTQGTIMYPAPFGATNWGAASIDEDRGLLIANSSWMPFIMKLVPRATADALAEKAIAAGHDVSAAGVAPQYGTPFGLTGWPMLSPLKIPCPAPPWGHLTAIDLAGNDVAWRRRLGTGRDNGPLGLSFGLPVEFGVPSMGGPTATRGGVTFIGASLDNYLRAYDSRTGRLLWKARLPAGGQASPMTYWSQASGRQFVVIAAGGHGALQTRNGDHLIAFALPRGATGKEGNGK